MTTLKTMLTNAMLNVDQAFGHLVAMVEHLQQYPEDAAPGTAQKLERILRRLDALEG